jgi:hypothetical protein
MNARLNTRELDRVRSAIGSELRTEHAVVEPAPQSLIALLKDLETRVRDAEREKLFAEVEARVAELLRATGRQPRDAHHAVGEDDDATDDWRGVRSPRPVK